MIRALDLCCGAGGMSAGLVAAGWKVTGVDIVDQPRYPYTFYRGDALEWPLEGYDYVHVSPPCQRFSDLAHRNGNGDDWPDLIGPLRERLQAWGGLWSVENVEGAPLHDPVMLCGTMFPTLRVIRHRLFESSFWISQPAHGRHPLVFTHDKRKAHYGRLDQDSAYVQVTGGGNCTVANKRRAMGIAW